MSQMPASIELYLQDSGFTSTEILVLKRLLIEGVPLTLRELAGKTGKSTGVLDQAVRKLMDKKIASRENINDTPKYAIISPESLAKWVEEDMKSRQAELNRKKENFEAFIATVQHEKGRPDMEFFEGPTGIKQAFEKLLEKEEKEWLQYNNPVVRDEDDPLRELHIHVFRERRRKKIFMRVLSPDIVLSRRCQSRDVFEYRDTRLLPLSEYPLSFTKYIVGDTVACFDFADQKASFIRFPALADEQRKMFEMLWCRAGNPTSPEACAVVQTPQIQQADIETKVFSGLREFFMSKSSVITLLILGLTAAGLTWGLYLNSARVNLERLNERVKAIAATGVNQFDSQEVNTLQELNDVYRPEYTKIVRQLMEIQQQNDDIMFTYLLRPTNEKGVYEFIAASDGLDPFAEVDSNGDGVIDDADEIVTPGIRYDITEMDALYPEAITKPMANSSPYQDQWGTFVTGYAPSYTSTGELDFVLSVDMNAEHIQNLTMNAFSPLLYFIGFFFIFVFIRLAAFHQPLVKELLQLSRTRKVLISLALSAFIALIATLGMYKYTLNLIKEEMGNRLVSIAATAALDINGDDLLEIHNTTDMTKPIYEKIYKQLNAIRDRNPDLLYVYILRPSKIENVWEFVVDADAHHTLLSVQDVNKDGVINNLDEVGWPGIEYDSTGQKLSSSGLKKPMYEIISDQWGHFISATSPILDSTNTPVAVLGLDIEITEVYKQTQAKFSNWIFFIVTIFALLIFRITLSKLY